MREGAEYAPRSQASLTLPKDSVSKADPAPDHGAQQEAKATPPPCSQVSSEESGSVTVHALRAAALDLSNQNLVQERMEYHIAKMDCK